MISVPSLDMKRFTEPGGDRNNFARDFGTAFEAIGFCKIVNHGIDPSLVESARQLTHELFTLPFSVKQIYDGSDIQGQRGYSGMGTEGARDATVSDLKEHWMVGREGSAEELAVLGITDVNRWPSEAEFRFARELRMVITDLFSKLDVLSQNLMRAVALHLEDSEDEFAAIAGGGDSVLRMLYYPPQTTPQPEGAVRAAAHEDINLLTLLFAEKGLEAMDRDSNWIDVNPAPEELCINAGDMLQNMTNGAILSTTHRVVNPQGTDKESARVALPYFTHPRRGTDLTPRTSGIQHTGGMRNFRFKDITSDQYLAERLAEIMNK